MAIEQEIQFALDSENPMLALRTLVTDVHKDGVSKEAIYHKFHWYSQRSGIPEIDHVYLLEVLDALSGFCAPGQRLIPGRPDVTG